MALALRKPILAALNQRMEQAVTYAYFRPYLGDLDSKPAARFVVRRQISKAFTADYERHGGGSMATGVTNLEAFDELALDFQLYDLPLLGFLANAIGLGMIADPLSTDVTTWRSYVLARSGQVVELLAGTVRRLLVALARREHVRTPGPSDDPDSFYGQHQVRRRLLLTLREAARVAEWLRPPTPECPPEEALMRAQHRLVWLGDQLGKSDTLTRAYLDEFRDTITMVTVDVVLVTVNDIETQALRGVLNRAGYRGRPYLGPINSYWLYGPISGTTVAHMRSAMGSTG